MYNTSTWSTNMLLNYTYSILHFFTESNFVLWVIPDIWDLCASDHIIPNSNIIHKIQCWISMFVLFGNFCPDTLKQLNFFYIYWYCQVLLGKYYCANQVNIDDLLFFVLLIVWGSSVSIFVLLCITVSFLVLQSPWRGRESCLLCYCCLADVLLL